MKSLFTSLLLFTILVLNAQTYNSPESVEYDANHQRYIVANTSANNLQQVIPGNAPTLFVSSVPGPYGIAIVGDTVYVCCNSTHLRGYNLTTGALAFDVNLGGTFLNGICTDFAGNIFVTDFSAKKIVRYNIASQQFNNFVSSMNKTPNGIVFDSFHNRLAVATWGTSAPILGVTLGDSVTTILKSTSLTNIDGLTIDEDGNFYAASWLSGGQGIYFFDSAFVNSPLRVVSFANSTNAADISYNMLNDTLAVPKAGSVSGSNTVTFHGFPRPKPINDFATTTVSVLQTICVLQNDLIDGNVSLVLQSFSSPQLGSAVANGSCIDYTATNIGTDTITYVVCSVDTPAFCKTAILFLLNVNSSGNNAPIAVNDTVTILQAGSVIVNVGANDLDGDVNDTLCVSSITGSNFFALDTANCTSIIFTPDSFFIGNDTCVYIICDNGSPTLCDTANLIVTVLLNVALLPVADFEVAFGNFDCNSFTTVNTSTGDTGTAVWIFDPQFTLPTTLYGDTGYYLNFNMHGFYGEVCLYVSNQFGSDTLCNSYSYICEGVEELLLSNIHIFPNPASNVLTIDMQNNNEEITRNYSSIEILNTLGERQKATLKKGTGKIVSFDVSDLPNGIYLATIISDKHEKRMLGKFTVSR